MSICLRVFYHGGADIVTRGEIISSSFVFFGGVLVFQKLCFPQFRTRCFALIQLWHAQLTRTKCVLFGIQTSRIFSSLMSIKVVQIIAAIFWRFALVSWIKQESYVCWDEVVTQKFCASYRSYEVAGMLWIHHHRVQNEETWHTIPVNIIWMAMKVFKSTTQSLTEIFQDATILYHSVFSIKKDYTKNMPKVSSCSNL